MTSDEPSRLGIHHLPPNGDIADRRKGLAGFPFEIKFHRLFQTGHGLFASRQSWRPQR